MVLSKHKLADDRWKRAENRGWMTDGRKQITEDRRLNEVWSEWYYVKMIIINKYKTI